MSTLDLQLSDSLSALEKAQRYRRRRIVAGRAGTTLRVEGTDCIAFCSTDYLGLAEHPSVVSAFQQGARAWGVGSGASHLISGHCREHHALEDELADFVERPRALLFSSGYLANLAVATTLTSSGDRIFEDRLNHASLLDGGWLSRAQPVRFPHADVAALRALLTDGQDGRSLVASDGVFSMDGDVAPLAELAGACREHDAVLSVDDAHGFGVLGANGRGSVEEAGRASADVPILMCTLGKAAGTFGAFVAGSDALIEYLIQRGRSYIYTTALPPAVAAATRSALRVIRDEGWRRERLAELIGSFRTSAASLGLDLLPSRTPIQPIILGGESTALRVSDALREQGIWIPAIRSPTVPEGTSRLRITFSASQSDSDLERLIEALAGLSHEQA
mgnify:CR=1 FL=1